MPHHHVLGHLPGPQGACHPSVPSPSAAPAAGHPWEHIPRVSKGSLGPKRDAVLLMRTVALLLFEVLLSLGVELVSSPVLASGAQQGSPATRVPVSVLSFLSSHFGGCRALSCPPCAGRQVLAYRTPHPGGAALPRGCPSRPGLTSRS